MPRSLMIQGTGSHVGKSVLTAALCRIFYEDGIDVTPFKSQNMALNSYVTEDGMEMGRAQVVQAEAAGLRPHVDMNPILLKPTTDQGSQVIIQGRVYRNLSASEFHGVKKEMMNYVKESYHRLTKRHDLIVIEGAGSPAEVNLRENDIANMGTAHMADAPVLLVGDIDRGGVFASLVGTLELLDDADRKRIKGFIINKFRGDISLLRPGLDFLEKKTGLPVLGVIPWFRDIYIQEEDGVHLETGKHPKGQGASTLKGIKGKGEIDIAVIHLPRISNFTDFDPLASEADVNLRYVKDGERIEEADIIIIPGSKSTLSDLGYLRNSGYAEEIGDHIQKGGRLIGICGGYQMLGESIADPLNIEGGGSAEGLGFLGIKTVVKKEKATHQVEARPSGSSEEGPIEGYEIHMGSSFYVNGAKPLFDIIRKGTKGAMIHDGSASHDGRVWGTYIHGIFDNDGFRRGMLDDIRRGKGLSVKKEADRQLHNHSDRKEEGYRRLSALVRQNIDVEALYRITGMPVAKSSAAAINH